MFKPEDLNVQLLRIDHSQLLQDANRFAEVRHQHYGELAIAHAVFANSNKLYIAASTDCGRDVSCKHATLLSFIEHPFCSFCSFILLMSPKDTKNYLINGLNTCVWFQSQ